MEDKANVGCLVCGAELVYAGRPETGQCFYCGRTIESYIWCPAGHLVCDDCHRKDALAVLARVCREEAGADPIALANRLLDLPYFSLHGPEHHALVPAALVAACGRATGEDVGEKVAEAIRRASRVPGGTCGLYGSCGAGVGVGVAVSVLAGATPLAREAWRLANQATARALWRIGERGGPRCCKRSTWTALEVGMEVLSAWRAVDWGSPQSMRGRCAFSARNRQCLRQECVFHPGSSEAGEAK